MNDERNGTNEDMLTGDVKRNMVCEGEAEVKNAAGLHMRPAMQFIDIANKYQSTITVSNAKTSADGKSIMQMSLLEATCGSRIKIRAEGIDANEAVAALKELVEVKKFGEPTPEEVKRGEAI